MARREGAAVVGAFGHDVGGNADQGSAYVYSLIAQMVVNTTGDSPDLISGNGVCDTGNFTPVGDPECTLRAAIQEANSDPDKTQIIFDIPGAGVPSIVPQTPLPPIVRPVILDATTQPGTGLVELTGTGVGPGEISGLTITAGDSTIKGMVINRFPRRGILLQTGGNNTIQGNYIGTDYAGVAARRNGAAGILISQSADHVTGGTTAQARNVL